MTTHPRSTQDLLLAPVAIEIDGNLRRIRDKTSAEIAFDLVLEIGADAEIASRDRRAQAVVKVATREVNLHDWTVEVTDDNDRLRLGGGSVTLDLGLSASLCDYITNGARATA